MTKIDSISCLPPGRALWIHVQTLRSRWHNSCRPKWVRYFLTQMFVPDDLVDVPKGELVCVWLLEVVPSPFQLLWKAVLFHTLCVLLVHPSSLTSPQYQYNYQNCQNMKLSSWWWILFFPKSNRNLRGFHKKNVISWSKPRVSFENSRGLGLMVSDNVPAASFGDSGRALLNKKNQRTTFQLSSHVIHKIHCAKLVLLFSFGPFVLVVGRDGAVERPIRSLQTPPQTVAADPMFSGRALVNFSRHRDTGQKKGGQPTREKARSRFKFHKTGTLQLIFRVLDLWRFSKVARFNGDHGTLKVVLPAKLLFTV